MRRNMNYSCSFVSVWLFWTGLMVGQQNGECAVPVKGVVSLETADRSMPGTIFLDILLNGQNVHLNLSQNPDVDPNCPVYILSTDPARKTQLTKVRPEKSKDLAFYVDSINSAALHATRGNQKDEPLHLEGILCTSGKTYSIKSKELSNTGYPRSKRAVNGYLGKQVKGRHIYKEMFEVEEVLIPTFDPLDILPDSRRNATSQSALNYEDLAARRNPTFQSARSKRKRYKRQEQQHMYIDILAVVDFALYSRYYSKRTETADDAKKSGAITEIHLTMLIIINGMSMLYKTITTIPYTIHVGFTSIVIATTAAESWWSENKRLKMTPIDWVYGSSVRSNIKQWAATTTTLPNNDHVMAFTGLDIYFVDSMGISYNTVAGQTEMAVLCDKRHSVSLIEHHGGSQVIFTATHELGHTECTPFCASCYSDYYPLLLVSKSSVIVKHISKRLLLAAQHDGEFNNCPKDRHIMAADNTGFTEANKLNPWKFSSCSINKFKAFIDELLQTNEGIQCIRNPLPRSKDLPQTLSKLPGQLYPPNEQCRMTYGDGSYLCEEFVKTPSDICAKMYCSLPNIGPPASCFLTISAQGTTCGNGKWCINGECVYDDDAPSANEDCVFGDDYTFISRGQNCTVAVGDNLFFCYHPPARSRCCESCAKKYRPVKDCEYGNQQSECARQHCGSPGNEAYQAYQQACCETCNFGSPFTPTTTTPRPPRRTTTPFTGESTPAYKDCPGNKDRQDGCDRQVCVYANDDYKRACCYTCNPASPLTTTTLKPGPPLSPAPITLTPGGPLPPAPATLEPCSRLTQSPTTKPGSRLTPGPATNKSGSPLPPAQSTSPKQDPVSLTSVTAQRQKWWLQLSVVALAVLTFN